MILNVMFLKKVIAEFEILDGISEVSDEIDEMLDSETKFYILCNMKFKRMNDRCEDISDLENLVFNRTELNARLYVFMFMNEVLNNLKTMPFPEYNLTNEQIKTAMIKNLLLANTRI